MGKSAIIVMTVFLLLNWCDYPVASQETSVLLKKCSEMEIFHQKAVCIKNVLLTTHCRKIKEEMFNTIMDYWNHKDGAMGFTLSDIFLQILEKKPYFFFSQMNKYQRQFDEWLQDLPYLSFTWSGNPPSPLPKKKTRLIRLLSKNFRPKDKEIGFLEDKFLEKLRLITPRQVN